MSEKIKDHKSFNKRLREAIKVAVGDNAFVNMVSGIGTARDKASYAEYLPSERIDVKTLDDVYMADWIAETIINQPALDSVRAGWYYQNLTPDQDKAIKLATKKTKLVKNLLQAVALSRLHGWSFIMIGKKGQDDLSTPLVIERDSLSFFSVLRRDECQPKHKGGYLSADYTKGSFKEPEFYQIGSGLNLKDIHHSRLVRIDAPDLIKGKDGLPMPVLQQIYETLKRLAATNGNAASLVYEAKIDVIKTPNLLGQLKLGSSGLMQSLVNHYTSIGLLKSNNGMIVLDKDEEYQSKSYSFAGLPELMREFSVQTAGAAKIPYSLLFGQSPAGMNSTGGYETRNYYDSILTMQITTLQEPIEYLLEVMAASLGFEVDDFGIVFNTLWQVDEKTRSEIELSNAQRDEIYYNIDVLSQAQIARQLKDDGTYTVIDDADINLLDSVVNTNDDIT